MVKLIDKQKEAEVLKDYLVGVYQLEPIKIKVKNIWRGRSSLRTRFISIPSEAYNEGIHYFRYYIIHEVCHFICYEKFNSGKHGSVFKEVETKILKEFGLVPVYKKVYIKELRDPLGKLLYKR